MSTTCDDPFEIRETIGERHYLGYNKYITCQPKISKSFGKAILMDEEKLKPELVSVGEKAWLVYLKTGVMLKRRRYNIKLPKFRKK